MKKHVILHDLRLEGIAPHADFKVVVNGTDPLRNTFERIRGFARSQDESVTLDILCHGDETYRDAVGQQSVTDPIGGGGLQLCRERLTLGTVHLVDALAGVTDEITVYACSAAETHPGYEGTNRDGQKLFRQIARRTGATVLAADASQWGFMMRTRARGSSSAVIDFRNWEGNLYRFDPDGTVTLVQSNQLEAH